MGLCTQHVFLACISGVNAAGLAAPAKDEIMPDNLVRAIVRKVDFHGGEYCAVCDVTHVYKGDSRLRGMTFAVTSLTSGETDLGAPSFAAPLRPRDIVIWLLHANGDRLEHVPRGVLMKRTGRLGGAALPARKGDSFFPDVAAWSEAVEQTVNAPQEKRWGLLEQYALSRIRYVAGWGLAAMAETDARRAGEHFRALLRRKHLTVGQKAMVDRMLAQIEPDGWRRSAERVELYRKWVSGSLRDEDAREFGESLSLMLQQPPFPVATVFRLVETVVWSENASPESRATATALLLEVRRYPDQRKRVFDSMLRLLKSTRQPHIQLAAARVVRHAVQEEAQSHRGEVLAVQESVQNDVAKKLLRDAIQEK